VAAIPVARALPPREPSSASADFAESGSEEEVLARLLALNLERAARQ
jgi:hypothetical protein